MRAPVGLPKWMGPKWICFIHPTLEEFGKLQGKDNNDKTDFQSVGAIVLKFNRHKDWWKAQGPLALSPAGNSKPYAYEGAK